ncbi:MAG: DUF2513 domain-containing protein [Bacteroidetes bacterium]|nr:DUF2513 domain-containing protein [Bacteroidota bacterium]
MKRDLDLIRDLLLRAEQVEPGVFLRGENDVVEGEHVRLLIESGYVEGGLNWVGPHGEVRDWEIHRLTMKGHDFISNLRSPAIFAKVKALARKTTETASLEVLGQAGATFVLQALGLDG